jgi:hypothetical protein
MDEPRPAAVTVPSATMLKPVPVAECSHIMSTPSLLVPSDARVAAVTENIVWAVRDRADPVAVGHRLVALAASVALVAGLPREASALP